jgi:hypothetical protein
MPAPVPNRRSCKRNWTVTIESWARHGSNKAYRSYALAVLSGRSGDTIAAAEHMADGDRAVTPIAWFQHHAHRLVHISNLAVKLGVDGRAALVAFAAARAARLSR